jgi:ABC-2 type transport system permease protein
MLVSYLVPEGFSNLKDKETYKIGIVDHSKEISNYLESTEKYKLIQMDSVEAVEQMWGKNIKGFIVIPQNPDSGEIIYYSSSLNLELWPLREILRKGTIKLKLKERGLNLAFADELSKGINLIPKKITERSEKSSGGEMLLVGLFMVVFLYMFIILASQLMARSVIEEKLNGIIELIISDITPQKLLLGKFLGISVTVLLLLAVWGLIGITFLSYPLLFLGHSLDFSLSLGVIIYFLFAFIFGYTLYTFFIILFVSTVNSEEEVNQALTAGIIIILIPYFLSFFWVMQNPSSVVSVISSLIPFFTPLIMPLRLAISTVPLWQSFVSVFLLILTSWFIILLAGKVYRLSMLLVGKPLKFREVYRLLRKS